LVRQRLKEKKKIDMLDPTEEIEFTLSLSVFLDVQHSFQKVNQMAVVVPASIWGCVSHPAGALLNHGSCEVVFRPTMDKAAMFNSCTLPYPRHTPLFFYSIFFLLSIFSSSHLLLSLHRKKEEIKGNEKKKKEEKKKKKKKK